MRALDDHQSHLIASLMRNSRPATAVQALANDPRSKEHREDAPTARSHGAHVTRDELLTMAQSRDPYVRALVGAREDCPMGLLIALADDRVVEVRRAVARNPNAIASVLEQLARDKRVPVVLDVAANPALPHDALVALSNNKHRIVRDFAQARLLHLVPTGSLR